MSSALAGSGDEDAGILAPVAAGLPLLAGVIPKKDVSLGRAKDLVLHTRRFSIGRGSCQSELEFLSEGRVSRIYLCVYRLSLDEGTRKIQIKYQERS